MLTAADIKGLVGLPVAPCKEGHDGWDSTDSVDLEEVARMTENLIRDGVDVLAFFGTTGEGATLLVEEKQAMIDTVAQVARKRVPLFAGVTSLNTRETYRQMKLMKAAGADGAFSGLPLWQTPTNENAVQYFTELGEAMPDMPLILYANRRFFKSEFPNEFWALLAKKAPTVIATKVSYGTEHLKEDLDVAGHQINFLVGVGKQGYEAYKKAGRKMTAGWSTGVNMGPEPLVAMMDAIIKEDEKRIDEIAADMRTVPPMQPPDDRIGFDHYNTEAEKLRAEAAGYIKTGPSRTPYRTMPEVWRQHAIAHGKGWAELRKKYMKVPTK
jgi:trans-o-hydroxybenzylidenepyruvate hydratase-aldolase